MASSVWAVINSKGKNFCDYTALDGFEDNSTATVPTEAQENGALYAYDKVSAPSECSVSLLFSGDYVAQQSALNVLEGYRRGTELVRIITPSKVYTNMALVSYGFTRSAVNGANALEVHCDFREIVSAQVGGRTVQWSPKSSNDADKVQTGQTSGKSGSVVGDIVKAVVS